MTSARFRWSAMALTALLAWLVGYPILVTFGAALGLDLGGAGGGEVGRFAEFVRRPDELLALWRSLWIALASVGLSAAIGIPLAVLFSRWSFPGSRWLAGLVPLPIALPPLVGTVALYFLAGESGVAATWLRDLGGLDRAPWRFEGPTAILIVHTYSFFVYYYLFVRAALLGMDASQEEAAASLGAGHWRTWLRVVLPQLWAPIAAASVLTFMTSLASFSAPYLFGGTFRVMTTQIVTSKLNGDLQMAQVETVVLALLALGGLLLSLKWSAPTAVSGHGVAPRRRDRLVGWRRWGVATLAWIVTLLLLTPHATLLRMALAKRAGNVDPGWALDHLARLASGGEALRPLANSLWMATAATVAAVVLGFAAARLALAHRHRLSKPLEFLVSVPWAIPGTVLALALITTFSVHRPLAGRFILVGTAAILPLAYLLRGLPLVAQAAFAGLKRLDPALEEAASSLGAGGWRRLTGVVLPVVRPSLVAGAALAFLTGVGDFVTSIVLYTYDTRPAAVEIWSALRTKDIGVAAAYGVVLMVISIAVFMTWGRRPAASGGREVAP